MSKISGYVPKTFRDEGTKEEFEGGKTHQFEPGPFGNYKAAGLIGEPPVAGKTAPDKGAAA